MAKKKSEKKDNKKDKKSKEAKKKQQNGVRKKILRSDYEKHQNRKINQLLGVPLDDQTGFVKIEEEKPSFWERLFNKKRKEQFRTLLDLTDRDQLMLIRAHKEEIKDKNRIKFSVPIVLLSEILSILILCIYILVIAHVATPTNSTDFLNIVFIIIAHFMSTAVLIGNDVSENGLNFTMYKTAIAVAHWIAASIVMFVMHSMYQPSAGAAVFFQIAFIIVAASLYIMLNLYKYEIMKSDVGYREKAPYTNPSVNKGEESTEEKADETSAADEKEAV